MRGPAIGLKSLKLGHGGGKGCDGSSGCLGVVLTATIDLLVLDGNLKGSDDGASARVHFLLNRIYLGLDQTEIFWRRVSETGRIGETITVKDIKKSRTGLRD
jgi:hypothetical protein